MVAISLSGCIFSKGQWSPDSRQLAFLAQDGDEDLLFPDGWLLGIDKEILPSSDDRTARQIWIGDVQTNRLALIEETKGWLSIPAWAPDGKSIAYIRFVPGGSDGGIFSGRLELVRRHRNGTTDVLRSLDGDFPRALVELLPYRVSSWSPNGVRIACPWIGSRSLMVWNVESKSLEAEWPMADMPSFSPDGRWLAVYDRGARPGFRVFRTGDWSTDIGHVDVASAVQPALWDPVGDAFYVARPPFFLGERARERIDFGSRRGQQARFIVARVAVPSMTARSAATISRSIQKYGQFLSCDFDGDWGREEFLASVLGDGMSSRIETFQPHASNPSRSWHPFDSLDAESLLPVGAIACSPDGRWTAMRFGLADWSAPIALRDRAEDDVRIWAPTPAVRMRALWAILQTLSRQVREVPSGTPASYGIGAAQVGENRYQTLAHVASHPMELFKPPAVQRIREETRRASIERLADEGLRLLAGFAPNETTGKLACRLAEIELVLRYSREDYARALEALDKLDRVAKEDLNDVERLALAIVRVQALMGAERWDAARWQANRLLDTAESLAAREREPGSPPMDPATLDDQGKQQLLLERLWVLYETLFTNQPAPPSDTPPPPEPRRIRIPR